RLYVETLGPRNAGALPTAEPFSLVTILRGEDLDPQSAVEGGPVHRALEAITRWTGASMGTLASGRISSHPATPDGGPLLFGQARSRAVWDPDRFRRATGTALSCYHRNLLVGTLQTEALLGLCAVSQQLDQGAGRSAAIIKCESTAISRLVALYTGHPLRSD